MIRALVVAVLLTACGTAVGGTASVVVMPAGDVLVVGDRVVAWRATAAGWLPPASAVYRDGTWWALLEEPTVTPSPPVTPVFDRGDVIAATRADLDRDGVEEVVLSYRHPARTVPWDPRPLPTDARGRSAHLGVVDVDGTPRWLARRIPHPIGAIAACDGPEVAWLYTAFDGGTGVAAGAGTWHGFGFLLAPELPGAARVGCADIDGDGILDPVVLRRSPAAP